jgi:hypothetical protein
MFKYSLLEGRTIFPKTHRKIGQTYVFFSKNGQPLYTIGPHWPFFFSMFCLIFILGNLCAFLVIDKIGLIFQLIAIFLTLLVLFFFGLTAITDPGIIYAKNVENLDSENDNEKDGELNNMYLR